MRQAKSLEEERQQLLQQLESSRAVYRRMLTDTEDAADDAMPPYVYGEPVPMRHSGFPQSHTMRWIMRHPYLSGVGALALLMAGKKGLSKARKKGKKAEPAAASRAEEANADTKKSIVATTLGTSLATTAAMMLRNPAQMQAAMRAIGIAMNYYKSRRRHAR
jgi:hypothetical protein